jgi:hypothetical protein
MIRFENLSYNLINDIKMDGYRKTFMDVQFGCCCLMHAKKNLKKKNYYGGLSRQ